MIVFPSAKINLGLHIIKKRTDGFHELETCFYPVKELHWRVFLPAVVVGHVYQGVVLRDQIVAVDDVDLECKIRLEPD